MLESIGYSLLAGGGALLFLWAYSKYAAQKPRVYVKVGSDLHRRVHEHLSLVKEYQPSWWCPFGVLMTIVRQVLRSCPSLPFTREIIEFSDGGVAALDFLADTGLPDNAPIIVFLPGITGTTHECAYILHAAMEAQDNNWRCVVVNPRALGGVPVKTSRTYNAAYPGDIEHALTIISGKFPDAKKIGCGFSMGGMILWNYLATKTAESANLDAAMIVSSPFDPHVSSLSLERFIPRLFFNSHLAQCLVRVADPHRHLFEHLVDFEHVKRSKTIREFDTRFTASVFGYKDCAEYYTDAALFSKVSRIPIPTVTLNSVDDDFAPIESLPLSDISQSERVVALVTSHGGHTSYMEGTNPNNRGYVEKLLSQWGDMIFNNKV